MVSALDGFRLARSHINEIATKKYRQSIETISQTDTKKRKNHFESVTSNKNTIWKTEKSQKYHSKIVKYLSGLNYINTGACEKISLKMFNFHKKK